jgi:hypothetical protein
VGETPWRFKSSLRHHQNPQGRALGVLVCPVYWWGGYPQLVGNPALALSAKKDSARHEERAKRQREPDEHEQVVAPVRLDSHDELQDHQVGVEAAEEQGDDGGGPR